MTKRLDDARCLSLSQPWEMLVLHYDKRIENRQLASGQRPPLCLYRGTVILHRAKSVQRSAAELLRERFPEHAALAAQLAAFGEGRARPVLQNGIVGSCEAVGHIEPIDRRPHIIMGRPGGVGVQREQLEDRDVTAVPGSYLEAHARGLDLRWWVGGYALVFDAVVMRPFIAWPGRQGLWRPTHELLRLLEQDMRPGIDPPMGVSGG